MSRLTAPSSINLSPAEEESDVDVTRDDQQRINEFGRLNARKHELRDEIAAARGRGEALADAEEAILLADETAPGALKLQLGDGFFDVEASLAQAFVDGRRQRDTEMVAACEAELRAIAERQTALKALLYGKFGKAINLEDKEA